MKKQLFLGSAKMLVSGAGLYVFAAACSATNEVSQASKVSTSREDGSSVTQDSSTAQTIADAAHAMIDAMVTPVDAAQAAGEDAGSCNIVCPAPAPVLQSVESGTRLKRKVLTGADGSRQVNQTVFFDSSMNMNCSYRKLADGNMHCTPANSAKPYKYPVAGYSIYTDSSCANLAPTLASIPIGLRTEVTTIIEGEDATSVISSTRIYQRGAEVSGQLYASNGGSCFLLNNGSWSWANYYFVGAEIPASTYVQAAETTE